MIAFTLILFLSAALVGYLSYWMDRSRAGDMTAHTFIVDPPTMFVVGLLGTMLGLATRKGRRLTQAQFRSRKTWIDRLLTVFFCGFWCMELLSYFDVMKHPYDRTSTGNEFMWNGYVDLLGWHPFHFAQPTYYYWWTWVLIPAMVVVQWYSLRAGRALGYLFGFTSNESNWSRPKTETPLAESSAEPAPVAEETKAVAPES
jgi:hypothetical protein